MSTSVCLPDVVAKRPETLEVYLSQNGIKPLTDEEIRKSKKQGEADFRSRLHWMQKLLWIFRPVVNQAVPVACVFGAMLTAVSALGFIAGFFSFTACFGFSIHGIATAYIPAVAKVGFYALAIGWSCFFAMRLLIVFYSMQVWSRWEEVDIQTAWRLLPAGFPADISFLVRELSSLQGVNLTCEALGADPGLWASIGDKKVCVAWWNGDDVQIGSRL